MPIAPSESAQSPDDEDAQVVGIDLPGDQRVMAKAVTLALAGDLRPRPTTLISRGRKAPPPLILFDE